MTMPMNTAKLNALLIYYQQANSENINKVANVKLKILQDDIDGSIKLLKSFERTDPFRYIYLSAFMNELAAHPDYSSLVPNRHSLHKAEMETIKNMIKDD